MTVVTEYDPGNRMGQSKGRIGNPVGYLRLHNMVRPRISGRLEKKLNFHGLAGKFHGALCRFGEKPGIQYGDHITVDIFIVTPNAACRPQMETGPAPQRAFRIAQRLAVNTFQSNSGEAKLMRANFCALPVFQTSVNPAMASFGVRTSRITVFMIPPLNNTLEIGQ